MKSRKPHSAQEPRNNSSSLGRRVFGELPATDSLGPRPDRRDCPTVVRSLRCVGGDRAAKQYTRKKARRLAR